MGGGGNLNGQCTISLKTECQDNNLPKDVLPNDTHAINCHLQIEVTLHRIKFNQRELKFEPSKFIYLTQPQPEPYKSIYLPKLT